VKWGRLNSMPKVCPHCQGTGYSDQRVKPVFEYAGRRLPLRQAQVLGLLLDAEGRELQRDYIITQVYNNRVPLPRVVDAAVMRLRKNLRGTDIQIHSYRTGGYVLRRGMPAALPIEALVHCSRIGDPA
jgi:hypothetical protein